MIALRGRVRSWLVAGCWMALPALIPAQQPPIVTARSAVAEQPSISDWSSQLLVSLNSSWTEGKASERQRLIHQVAEQTPSHLAFVTRVLQQKDAAPAAQVISTLKETFSVLRRVGWQPGDMVDIQRIVASWSVMAPQLVRAITLPELTANQRRVLEQALVDLATISRDAQMGTPVARQTWQTVVGPLAELIRHPKASVRLVALNVLEAIGADAVSASAKVIQSLNDKDRYVRWYAIRTLESIGMDDAAMKAVGKLQQDEDAQVRVAACHACSAASSKASNFASASENKSKVAVVAPAKVSLPVAVTKPLEWNLPPMPKVEPPVKVEAVVSKPATPMTPAPLPVSMPMVPLQVPPSTKSVPEAVPLFGPPTSLESSKSALVKIQPAAAEVPVKQEIAINPVTLWLPRLKTGTVEQQLQAVQQLGKLGTAAADAVPALAEVLMKGDITVRREVPATLAQIGTPAKMATAVLESCLQDRDTEVKVNAARALLELADK